MNLEPSPEVPDDLPKYGRPLPPEFEASPEIVATLRLSGVIAACLFSVFFLVLIIFERGARAPGGLELLLAGYLYGALLSIIMFATIWSALGGGFFGHRFGFAALWNLGIFVTAIISLALLNGPVPAEVFIGPAVMLGAAWLLPQAPLWAIRFFLGIRFDIPGQTSDAKANQFGLRHLFIFTSIVAVLLGLGRYGISLLKIRAPDFEGIGATAYFLSSALILSLSLLVAAMLPRYSFYCVLLILGLFALVGYWEVSLLSLFADMQFGPDRFFFVWQKLCMAGWLLIFAYLLRCHDFRFIMASR